MKQKKLNLKLVKKTVIQIILEHKRLSKAYLEEKDARQKKLSVWMKNKNKKRTVILNKIVS